jgi:hypothetical protein
MIKKIRNTESLVYTETNNQTGGGKGKAAEGRAA